MLGITQAPSRSPVAADSAVVDPWAPRTEAWLSREPSAFATEHARPLFIGGCPRSGTTLLRSLLNNHPQLAVPAETNFVIPLWTGRVRYGDLRVAANRRRLAQWLFEEDGHGGRRIRAGRIAAEEAIERVVDSPPTLGSIFARCFEMYAEAHGKPRWGDKRPTYAGFIDALFALFPDAQFVNVIRDPRAVVASQLPLGWHDEGEAVASAAAMWESSVRRVDAFGERLRPDQLLDVRYEDLVRDPAAALAAICRFASLDGGHAIEQMITRERRGRFREGWHERVSKPISVAPIGSWTDRLDVRDVALVERVMAPYGERFGYAPVAGPDPGPAPAALAELRRQRRRRRVHWRKYAWHELKRRRVLYRRPVAVATPPARARRPR